MSLPSPVSIDPLSDFYILNDTRNYTENSLPSHKRYSFDANGDARRYQAFCELVRKAKLPDPRQSVWSNVTASLDPNRVFEYLPGKIGFLILQPVLPHLFYIEPFSTPPDADVYGALVVSREWKEAIEFQEPGQHCFAPVELHFMLGKASSDLFYLFTRHEIFSVHERLKLAPDYWEACGSGAVYPRLRKNAVIGRHWTQGPNGFIVSQALAAALSPLLRTRMADGMKLFPAKLVGDDIAKAYLDFPKLRHKLP